MKVRSNLATISYNSVDFLKSVLDRLTGSGVLAFWFYVMHHGEEGDKEHIHLFVMPGESLDPLALRNEFTEFAGVGVKPLRCLPFKKSKVDDALLYFIHDDRYLTAKGMQREYRYSFSDIVSSDNDYLKELWSCIDWTRIEKSNPASVIKDAVMQGMTFDQLVCSGKVPAQQISGWEKMYHTIAFSLRKDWYINNIGNSENREK